jgi:restriction system protein
MHASSAKPFQAFGGYRKLRAYPIAQTVYDATVVFCGRFLAGDRRLTDQMVQAARSGVRNISEGSGAAATSRKSEMLLTNVARASLMDELLPDYESFLRQRGLRVWEKDNAWTLEMRRRLKHDIAPGLPEPTSGKVVLTGMLGLLDFVRMAEPEPAANAMICAIHQCTWLLWRQMQGQMRQFEQDGGFSEELNRRRMRKRDS